MTTASVLALPGSFSLTAKTLSDANFNETLNLLLSSKDRTKAQSQKNVDLAGYYIKVTCNLNAHVTKTLNGNNADPAGETGVADDMFEFEKLNIAQSDFSDDINAQNKYMSTLTGVQQGTKADGKLWNDAQAFSEYRLKHFTSNFELGRITLNSGDFGATVTGTTRWAVKQSIQTEELPGAAGFSAKNLLAIPPPTVTEEVGSGNLVASITEDVTVAQYLHLTATAGTNAEGQVTELDKATQGDAFGIDSKYKGTAGAGADNDWISTSNQTEIDQLEDKLGLNVSKGQIATAYAEQITKVVGAGQGLANKKLITAWSVEIPRIGGADSLFSKHARAVYNSRGEQDDRKGTPPLFKSQDKIVVVHPNDHANVQKRGNPITHDLVLTIKDYNGVTQTLVDHSEAGTDEALRFILEQR